MPYNGIWQQLFEITLTKNPFSFKKRWNTWWAYHDNGMKHAKHGNHTMIIPWIMTTMPRNVAAIPSSWHDHDHVWPWWWHDSHVFPTWECISLLSDGQLFNCICSFNSYFMIFRGHRRLKNCAKFHYSSLKLCNVFPDFCNCNPCRLTFFNVFFSEWRTLSRFPLTIDQQTQPYL